MRINIEKYKEGVSEAKMPRKGILAGGLLHECNLPYIFGKIFPEPGGV